MPCVCVLVAQSYLILCDPTDYSLPGSSVHRILQAGVLEWVAIPLVRGSSQPRDRIQVSCIAGRVFVLASLVTQMVKNPPALRETWV